MAHGPTPVQNEETMTRKEIKEVNVPVEKITAKIYLIRGQKVMLDRDLSELYGVQTKVLKQAVRRNIKRFPSDFMFELTNEEFKDWRSQFVTSKSDKMGLRFDPSSQFRRGNSRQQIINHLNITNINAIL